MIKKVLLFSVIFSLTSPLFAQDKNKLQNQRDEIRKEITKTQQLLDETSKTAKVNIRQLALINKKVSLQENVVSSIHNEIRELSDNIYLSQLEINRTNRVLDTLKDEYAQSMVYAYKNRGNYSFLSFIFSSKSFNDAIKRITYLKSYRNFREIQASNIIKTQALLEARIRALDSNKKRKEVVLVEEGQERTNLEKQRNEQATIVKGLKSKQKELNAVIAAKKKEDTQLKNTIAAMVRREIERAKAEAARKEKERQEALKRERDRQEALKREQAAALAKNGATANAAPKSTPDVAVAKPEVKKAETAKPAAPSNSVLVNTSAEAALNANFESNRGRLPWPVNGFILYNFGNNTLPGGVTYYNYGVTIATDIGSSVKAVFDGEVTLVNYIEDNQTVYIRHGQYFTVYSNLTNVTVKRGDQVHTGQVLGKAGENDEGQGGRVDFLLLKESNYQNPQSWLK